MTKDEFDLWLEQESARRRALVRQVIREHGRPELLAEYDRDMHDLDLGLTGARAAWHSISPAQRRVMEALEPGRTLVRARWSSRRYDAIGSPHATASLCGLATVYNLVRRDLLQWDGPETDFNAKAILTERGRFVLKRGRTNE
jgi:hypothetical protein